MDSFQKYDSAILPWKSFQIWTWISTQPQVLIQSPTSTDLPYQILITLSLLWPLRIFSLYIFPSAPPCMLGKLSILTFIYLPFSFPFAYCGGLFLSMLLKLWLLRFKLEAPWTLVLLPAAGTLEGPGSLEW